MLGDRGVALQMNELGHENCEKKEELTRQKTHITAPVLNGHRYGGERRGGGRWEGVKGKGWRERERERERGSERESHRCEEGRREREEGNGRVYYTVRVLTTIHVYTCIKMVCVTVLLPHLPHSLFSPTMYMYHSLFSVLPHLSIHYLLSFSTDISQPRAPPKPQLHPAAVGRWNEGCLQSPGRERGKRMQRK